MNLQINAWSEYSSSNSSSSGGVSGKNINKRSNINVNGIGSEGLQKNNELADWFVKNKIVEHLFGPNLHVEVSLEFDLLINLYVTKT